MSIGNKRSLQAIVVIVIVVAIAGLTRFYRHAPAVEAMCEKTCLAAAGCDLSFDAGQAHKIGGDCLIRKNSCFAQCGGGKVESSGGMTYLENASKPAILGGSYGALAYDKVSGAWGLSDFSSDQESANRSALGYCERYGPHCVIVASFLTTCAAVATGENNTVIWAKGPNRETAQQSAAQKCANKTKTACTVQHSNCYFASKDATLKKEPALP